MTPEAAIYQFFSGFGIPAYAASSVPSEEPFPYITYDLVMSDGIDDGEVLLTANVWYRTDSEAEPNSKVREIHKRIGSGGITLQCDDGMIWLKRGTPWAQSVNVSGADEKIKRRYLNIDVEYLTIG